MYDLDSSPSVSIRSDEPLARPSSACVICPPPRGHAWSLADPRHVTCTGCYDRMRDRIAEIAERYLLLDARRGASPEFGGRGAPGFGSRSPGSEHVIAMRDPRSSPDARMWVAGDGRVHAEPIRPAVSVHGVLSLLAWSVAEHRGVEGPGDREDVHALLRFVDRHLDHVTRHAELAVEVDDGLRNLVGALRPVTGDARRRVGICPSVVADPGGETGETEQVVDSGEAEQTTRCGATLYAPLTGDAIYCPACGRVWPFSEWLDLGAALVARAEVEQVARAS